MIEHNGEIIFALMFVNRFAKGVCQFVVMVAPTPHSVTMNDICCNYKLYKNQCNAPTGPVSHHVITLTGLKHVKVISQ